MDFSKTLDYGENKQWISCKENKLDLSVIIVYVSPELTFFRFLWNSLRCLHF